MVNLEEKTDSTGDSVSASHNSYKQMNCIIGNPSKTGKEFEINCALKNTNNLRIDDLTLTFYYYIINHQYPFEIIIEKELEVNSS